MESAHAHVNNLRLNKIVCRQCIQAHFKVPTNRHCPKCNAFAGPKPLESLIKANHLQRIADWLFPEFKAREEALRQKLIALYLNQEEKNAELTESQETQNVDSN